MLKTPITTEYMISSRLRCSRLSPALKRYASSNIKSTPILRKPTFNVKHIIENQELYVDSIKRRANPKTMHSLNFILNTRPEYLEKSTEIERLKNERNKISKQFSKKDKSGSISDETKLKLTELKVEIQKLTENFNELERCIFESWEQLPNLLDPTVPKNPEKGEIVDFINGESENQITESRPSSDEFDHKKIGEELGIIDFQNASKVSGFSWYYLIGEGAMLEQALIQYGLSKARKAGYKMITPPTLVKTEMVNACGFKPKDKNEENHVYNLDKYDLALTGTAEIALAAFHSSGLIDVSEKPIKYVGLSRAYRAEAGSRGKDTKGLYRVHEFNKVELFHFTTAERAQQELEDLKTFQIGIIGELGLSAKMINMPTSDLGSPAMKKYDCEAWMPGRGNWGELTSSSNCGDYQSRRLGIKYRPAKGEKSAYVNTLNGTCVAVPRVIVAIIEQNYDSKTKSITIPEVLRPFMDGKDKITKNI